MKNFRNRSKTIGRVTIEETMCRVGGRQRPSLELVRSRAQGRTIVLFVDHGPWTRELRLTIV